MEGTLSPELRRAGAVTSIVLNAYETILARYGSGSGNCLPYHNELHFYDVCSAAGQIADRVIVQGRKLGPAEKQLIQLGAACHDVVQGLGSGPSEAASADFGCEAMAKQGCFSSIEIDTVRMLVLSTQVSMDNGIIRQYTEDNYLSQIVADADLASLGRETLDYWDRATALHREFCPDVELLGNNLANFAIGQLVVLNNHSFYTPEAAELFPYKSENIAFVESILRTCQTVS